MTGGIRIGRLFGIQVAIHPSWFVILALFAFTLATGFFPLAYDWSASAYWVVAVVATLLLFVSVLAHELGHSLVAQAQGIPVKNITLFFLGGVASIEKEASSPGREAVLAGIGPVVSLVIGFASWGLARAIPGPEYVQAVLWYLGIANVSLAVFNLLPGFPLDGGRVLRALLWWTSHDFVKATRRAARVGQVFGALFIAGGVAQAVTGSVFGGLWLGFIGWVLIQTSRASARQVVLERDLAGVTAGRLAAPPAAWLSPYVTLAHAAAASFAELDQRCLPVAPEHDGEVYDGVLCVNDLRARPREEWDTSRVRDAMTPAAGVPVVDAGAPAIEAIRLMASQAVEWVAVVADGRLLGFVDREAPLRYLERRRLVAPTAV